MISPAPMENVPSGTGSFLAAPVSREMCFATNRIRILGPFSGLLTGVHAG